MKGMGYFQWNSYISFQVALVYPGEEAVAMTSLTSKKGAEIEKLVFIDSTWSQAKHIFKDPRLQGTISIPPSCVNIWYFGHQSYEIN